MARREGTPWEGRRICNAAVDGPDPTGADALPLEIDRFRLAAALPGEPSSPTDIRLEGPSGPRERAHPLLYTVVDFRPPEELRCGGRRASITGTQGADRLVVTRRRDVIHAGDGNDRVAGAGGADLIRGGRDRDRLEGGPGGDRFDGGPGRDRVEQ